MRTDLKLINSENIIFPDLIRYPLSTEKVFRIGDALYAFKVMKCANKYLIKKAVESVFGVEVKAVRMLNMKGKRSFVKGNWAVRGAFKKAYVQLKPGFKIDMV